MEGVNFSDSKFNVYLNKKVYLEEISDTALFKHLEDNVQWLGGNSGDELTEEFFVNFISKVDGGGNLDNRDGVITEDEVQNWLSSNSHGDKFGSVQDILGVLSKALGLSSDQPPKDDETISQLAFDLNDTELNKEATNALSEHLAANTQWLGGVKGEELTSDHLKAFLAKIDGGDGSITRHEVESWLKNQGHGDKFGTVDDLMKMLNELVSGSKISEIDTGETNPFNSLGNIEHEGEYSSFEFDSDSVQLNSDITEDNALYSHLAANTQWLGGVKGEELTSEHLKAFLAKIDGGDGSITRHEVESWLKNQGHGDKFGTVDEFFAMLNEIVISDKEKLIDSSEGLTVKPEDISDEEIQKWIDDNNHGDKFGTITDIRKAITEIINLGLLELDENVHIDFRLMNLSAEAMRLLRHLENNTYFLEDDGVGDFLTSKHLKDFFLAHINNNLPTSNVGSEPKPNNSPALVDGPTKIDIPEKQPEIQLPVEPEDPTKLF